MFLYARDTLGENGASIKLDPAAVETSHNQNYEANDIGSQTGLVFWETVSRYFVSPSLISESLVNFGKEAKPVFGSILTAALLPPFLVASCGVALIDKFLRVRYLRGEVGLFEKVEMQAFAVDEFSDVNVSCCSLSSCYFTHPLHAFKGNEVGHLDASVFPGNKGYFVREEFMMFPLG